MHVTKSLTLRKLLHRIARWVMMRNHISNLVELAGVGGRVGAVEARASRRVIVVDQMDVHPGGDAGLDLAEERQEPLMTVLRSGAHQHLAAGNVQRGKQRGASVLYNVALYRGL